MDKRIWVVFGLVVALCSAVALRSVAEDDGEAGLILIPEEQRTSLSVSHSVKGDFCEILRDDGTPVYQYTSHRCTNVPLTPALPPVILGAGR